MSNGLAFSDHPPQQPKALHSLTRSRLAPDNMQGWLDVLESHGALGATRKTWNRRFLALNSAFQALEVFKDETQQERVDRIDLSGEEAAVATAAELGEALVDANHSRFHSSSAKLSVENSRRFVFRVTDSGKRHHYLCAEVNDSVAANRQTLEMWHGAIYRVLSAAATSRQATQIPANDTRGLPDAIAAFTERLHLSATVVARRAPGNSPAQYELLVKAWVLARELVESDVAEGYSHQSWQLIEYSCEWHLGRTTAQLKEFDTSLRQFAGRELRDVAFPSVSTPVSHVMTRLLHQPRASSESEDRPYMDADTQRRIALYDGYFQSVLRLPALSTVGSNVATVFDTFLDVSSHLAALRKVERETSISLHLSQRRVVPWERRARFEELHALYMEQLQAREAQLAQQVQRKQVNEHKESRRGSRNAYGEREHRRHHHKYREHEASQRQDAPVAPLPSPLPEPVKVKLLRNGYTLVSLTNLFTPQEVESIDSVQERIARIGHKLIAEAFMLPAGPRAPQPVV